ncbi:MAG: 16S rRNA (adenine(1518)-N(6)/adenine(1519)-N(6))-dimethyltransferase RsmA [Oscillospiraceae bacterium]|nr:16S rRNA (adenine(1518)-N(6)/adenine(1519)-N(6))-dimethyltransferase RsmA [Oscillospiraceae bacterium]
MELCNLNVIRELLERHGFHFSKSMGQNFLIDPSVPMDIAAASGADKSCGVLEIGPGIGPLTQELCHAAGKVVSVELDKALLPVLAETMGEFENFTLIPGDIMKVNIRELVEREFTGLTPLVCANLPYNITTPVLTALVNAGCFRSITVLIQKEVAERICARPGTADYGAFTVFMQFYAEVEKVFDVPNICFVPKPKVTSAVLHCRMRGTPAVAVSSEAMFHRTVRGAFAMRRKTLLNSLAGSFGEFSKEQLSAAIEAAGLTPDIRGEKMNLEQFAALSNALSAMQKED